MPLDNPFLFIVIPAFNEEQLILSTLDQVTSYLGTQDYSWDVLVADDGSSDNTAALVQQFADQHPQVVLLSLPHQGKGGAVRDGMLRARGRYRFLCDADLSMPIEHLARFLSPDMTGYDIAVGSREAKGARRFNEPRRRHLMGRVFNALTRLLAIRGISDTQCGFKCYRGPAADLLFSLQRIHGFGFDAEVLFVPQRMGMRLTEVPIDWYYRSQSKVRPFRDSSAMVRDLLRVRWYALRRSYGRLVPGERTDDPTGGDQV